MKYEITCSSYVYRYMHVHSYIRTANQSYSQSVFVCHVPYSIQAIIFVKDAIYVSK